MKKESAFTINDLQELHRAILGETHGQILLLYLLRVDDSGHMSSANDNWLNAYTSVLLINHCAQVKIGQSVNRLRVVKGVWRNCGAKYVVLRARSHCALHTPLTSAIHFGVSVVYRAYSQICVVFLRV